MGNVKRIYVEKKEAFAVKAMELEEELKSYLGIAGLKKVRIFIRYDVENISEDTFEKACKCVFSEPPVDDLHLETIEMPAGSRCFSVEYLPGQFDHTQVTRYVVVEDAGIKAKIAEEATLGFEHNNGIIKGCAALVVVNMVHGRSGFERDGSYTTSKEDRWEVFDAGLATQTFCLAAHDKGIGAVILGIFDENKVAEIIGIDEGQKVAALVAVGYADEEPAALRRKGVEELVKFI